MEIRHLLVAFVTDERKIATTFINLHLRTFSRPACERAIGCLGLAETETKRRVDACSHSDASIFAADDHLL